MSKWSFRMKIAAGAAGIVLSGPAILLMSGTASADPGANGNCGNYCPYGVGNPSGNGNATNQPAQGTVGNADSKNPPGQYPDGSDSNNGYECDGNQGIAQGNPAHSGCYSPTPTPSQT